MSEPYSEKRHEIQEGESHGRHQRAPSLEGQDRKEILREIVDHAACPSGPANRYQVAAEDVALREAGIFYNLAELHVVEHFHAQGFVGSHCLIHTAPNQVECAYAHVILRLWIGDFPRAMAEHKHGLKEGDHHEFTRTLHNNLWKHLQMISFT